MTVLQLSPNESKNLKSFVNFQAQIEGFAETPQWLKSGELDSNLKILSVHLEGEIVAAMWFRVFEAVAEIDYILTLPTARKRGYGKALLSYLIAAKEPMLFSEIWLEVEDRNGAAMALYESLGFGKQGVRKDYYGPGCHALNYSLRLL